MHLKNHNKYMFKHSSIENVFPGSIQVHIADSSNVTTVFVRCLYTMFGGEKKLKALQFFFIRRQSSTFIKPQRFTSKRQSSTLQGQSWVASTAQI